MSRPDSILYLCPACGNYPTRATAAFDFVDCACGLSGPGPVRGLSSEEAWNVMAEALVGDIPWIGAGPTVEEAGGESILVRDGDGGDLIRSRWNHTIEEWISDIPIARPSGWRRMPALQKNEAAGETAQNS